MTPKKCMSIAKSLTDTQQMELEPLCSEDSITKFKSQGLYTIEIKYWNASESGLPPPLIPALWNIGILHYKKAKLRNNMRQSVSPKF